MPAQIGLFVISLGILLLSTRYFIRSAVTLSGYLRISPLVIGTIIVALGTSIPELSVSLGALAQHDAGLALGNIVGSNIANVFLVFSIGLLSGRMRVGTTKTQINSVLLLIITFLFLFFLLLPIPHTFSGSLLVFLSVLFTFYEYSLGLAGRAHEDHMSSQKPLRHFRFSHLCFLIFSLLGIVGGALLIVSSVEAISSFTGYSTTVLGLSLTAIATSLPELLTTIFAQKDRQSKVALGNLSGSNIYNLAFIGGLLLLFSPVSYLPALDVVWLVISALLFSFILSYYQGREVPRRIGLLFLLLFVLYLFSLA